MKTPPGSYANRRPEPVETLSTETLTWLDKLPPEVRPRSLPIEFPRIVNALHTQWAKPRVCLDYLDDLMLDKRGGRQGFPGPIVFEIANLKDHYASVIHPTPRTVWDHISPKRH